jgi:hypothetical protein
MASNHGVAAEDALHLIIAGNTAGNPQGASDLSSPAVSQPSSPITTMARRRARNAQTAEGETPTRAVTLFKEPVVFIATPLSNHRSKREAKKNPRKHQIWPGSRASLQTTGITPKRHRGNIKSTLLCISRTPLSLPRRTTSPPVRRGERAGALEVTLNSQGGGEYESAWMVDFPQLLFGFWSVEVDKPVPKPREHPTSLAK